MDIMMRLKGAGFSVIANEFRQREKRLGSGLPLQDFVEIVLQGLPKPKTPEEKYANISALVDLFDDMDINGDGAMEFDEFTSYCVDAGMVATRTKTANLKHRYVRNTRHVIKTTNGSLGIEKVRWSPLFQRFLVVENAAKSVKIFHADGYMVGDVRSQSTLLNAPPTEDRDVGGGVNSKNANGADESVSPTRRSLRARGDDATSGSGGGASSTSSVAAAGAGAASNSGIFILDAVFLHKFQCLAMSTTDFVISFYSMEEPKHPQRLSTDMLASTARSGPTYDVLPKLTITTTTAQLLLRFCENAGLLFSSGNDFIVNVWKIEDLETKTLWKRLIHHQDMIMDIVEIPMHDMIASCDLNHMVQLWDIHDCRSRGALVGHTRGIKQMVFSKDHDLLLTAGFEFDAYGWDIASRQVVMKLAGHRAPLVGVQLAQFQTERAITADASGVIKVWDISRATGSSSQSTSTGASSHQVGRGASYAVLLESLDPTQELSRFDPTTLISLHPHRRDVWTAASGSATLHLFRSTRVQQFDEIPLKAFYHYNANRFVVVSGPVCSIWDGETGACVDEFNDVGAFIGNTGHTSAAGKQPNGGSTTSTHNGAAITPGLDALTDILLCVQDSKCKKLVMLSEEGEMGVFNCQNFVQMRRCDEKFRSVPPNLRTSRAGFSGSLPPPSCGIVGLHYCSENKLIIATDSHTSSICVIDDSNNDSSKGIRDTIVLRRLINIPGGIAASAYSYHASMVATLDEATNSKVSLWDFETLVSVGSCQMEEEDMDAGASFQVLTFWDEFPVVLGADSQGGVYFFAAMPTVQAKTGKLLHAFINDHTLVTVTPSCDEADDDAGGKAEELAEENNAGATFITESAESAARKFLLKRKSHLKAIGVRKSVAHNGASGSNKSGDTQQPPPVVGGVVTCMQVVLDDDDQQHRYLLFTGDEKGVIRVWSLSDMMRRLSLFKIPETSCKYLRRGYHPHAMFAHDSAKQPNIDRPESGQEGGGATVCDASSDSRGRSNQAQLKKLTKQRLDAKKRSSTATSSPQLAKLLAPNRVMPGHAPPSSTAVAAAEAFLVPQPSLRRSSSAVSRAGSRSSSLGGSAFGGAGALIRARAKPAENRRRSYCWQHQDVMIVNVWTAHSDGITSLEVSKHPNILVTCSLDMRVFVWNWQGACLGKLFDAENVGPCRWRFRKDDSKRDNERQVLVEELLHELELPPQQKAHRRRQTLYQSHVQRKSQKELSHVNVMLIDHIVSQHPEVAAMEKEGLSNASTDENINAEMERTRQRNYRAKERMLEALARASTCSGSSHSKEIVRMHSLAQVGPLLCVDKFEMKQELQQMKFAEKDELKMDRQYLEGELGVGSSSTKEALRGSANGGSLASIKEQIRHAQHHAEDMLENKIALQRHALAMYSNLHQTQRMTSQQARESLSLVKQATNSANMHDSKELIASQLNEMLEPSSFLRSKLPDRLLNVRPQTAPSPKGSISLTRAKRSSNVQRNPNLGHVSAEVEANRKYLRPLTATASESSLQGVRRESLTQATSRATSTTDSSKVNRRSSLDQMYLDELQHQGRPSIKRMPQSDEALQELAEMSQEQNQAGEDVSLRKLDTINSIILKAQDMCDTSGKVQKEGYTYELPYAAPLNPSPNERETHRQRSSVLPTLHEIENSQDEHCGRQKYSEANESELRRHLEATRRRMEIAMGDSERRGGGGQTKRSMINKKREDVEHQKKGRRMEDYLQQKRREMNTNIGAVFKRTSFAFPSTGAMIEGGLDAHDERTKKKPPTGGQPAAETADRRALQEAQAQVEKSKVFGMYGVKEVMSIIRLFWSMDEDCSGTLSMAELLAYKAYFGKLGYHDMATVFQAIDKDGSGNVTLKELLEICFQYATKYQIEEMLKLAKLGDVASYFDASQRQRTGVIKGNNNQNERGQRRHGDSKGTDQDRANSEGVLTAEERAELLAIFRVFDRNGDGGIGLDEIMEALHVDEDDTFERVAAAEEAQLAERDVALGGSKRKPSVFGSPTRTRNSSSAFTKEEVLQFYQDVDTDGDQSLNFEEFVVLMQMLHGSRR